MKLTTLDGLTGSLRQPTKYDAMLGKYVLLAATDQDKDRRKLAAATYDALNTVEAAGFLNAQSVSSELGALTQANQLYVYLVDGGDRPAWINSSIQDSDFESIGLTVRK